MSYIWNASLSHALLSQTDKSSATALSLTHTVCGEKW